MGMTSATMDQPRLEQEPPPALEPEPDAPSDLASDLAEYYKSLESDTPAARPPITLVVRRTVEPPAAPPGDEGQEDFIRAQVATGKTREQAMEEYKRVNHTEDEPEDDGIITDKSDTAKDVGLHCDLCKNKPTPGNKLIRSNLNKLAVCHTCDQSLPGASYRTMVPDMDSDSPISS
jgi:hypothetical protein